MRGRFVGETSMGFVHGQIYNVRSEIKPLQITTNSKTKTQTCIVLRDKDSAAWCPYGSLEAVMRNWEFNLIHTKYNHI